MATIPRVNVAQGQLKVSQGSGLSPAQATAPFKAVTQAGMQMKQMAERSMQRDGETKAMKDFSDYQVKMIERRQQLEQESISDPEGYTDKYLNAAQEEFSNIMGDNTNKYYTETMNARFESMRPRMAAQAIQFEAKQKVINQTENLKQSVSNLSLLIQNDLKNLPNAIAQLKGNIASAKENAIIPNTEEIERESISSLYTAAVEGYIDQNNIIGAKKFLNQESVQEKLGYDNTIKAQQKIASIEKAKAKEYNNLFYNDPAQLAINNGAIQGNIQSIIDTQIELGVPAQRISILPKQSASMISDQLNNAKNTDEFMLGIEQVRSSVGDEYMSYALKDLKKANLSEQSSLILMMNPTTDKQLANALFEMSNDKESIEKLAYNRPDMKKADIVEGISDAFADSAQIIAEENAMGITKVAEMEKSLVDMATYFVAQGKDKSEAVELATDWINSRIPKAEINGKLFGVPEGYNPDEIESVIDEAMDNIKWGEFEAEKDINRRTVYPVLSDDESFYYYKNAIGEVVAFNGEVIKTNIEEAIQAKSARISAAIERHKTKKRRATRRGRAQINVGNE